MRLSIANLCLKTKAVGKTIVTTLAVPTSPVTYIEPRIHFPRNSRTSRSQATGTQHPNNFHKQTLWLSHCDDHGPKPTWWPTSSCVKRWKLHVSCKNSFGRFTSHMCADRLDMFAIKATLDKPRLIMCLIQKLTQLESRTQQERNPHASETKIVRRDTQTFSPQNISGQHIVDKSPLVAHILTLHRWNLHCNAHQRWSHQTSWRPHRQSSGSKTTNLVHPRIPMVESLHDSCKKAAFVV